MNNQETVDTCVWCGKTEAEHGELAPILFGKGLGRLCPVPGVSSQYWTSKAAWGKPPLAHHEREIANLREQIAVLEEQFKVACERSQRHHDALYQLVSFALTCKKRNQPEWMASFAAELNKAMAVLEVGDTVKYPGSWSNEFQFEIDSKEAGDGPAK